MADARPRHAILRHQSADSLQRLYPYDILPVSLQETSR